MIKVSTHSRPKAAGLYSAEKILLQSVSTHSRPKAAGRHGRLYATVWVFQLTAARRRLVRLLPRAPRFALSFNSQPPEGGWGVADVTRIRRVQFQLTAARRRLGNPNPDPNDKPEVSTHSRPKAAGP